MQAECLGATPEQFTMCLHLHVVSCYIESEYIWLAR
ncbi:MAG: hypothetical protein J07HQX50_00965, partial [Haloquadratum sp. J07HQX50]